MAQEGSRRRTYRYRLHPTELRSQALLRQLNLQREMYNAALEERIVRAVEMVKRERLARAEAEKRADAADARLREAAPLTENLQKEVSALRGEREQVRQRVERLLSQLDALEL